MKILSAEQIRQWDEFTIQHEPVQPIDLMERAAIQCTNWIIENYPATPLFSVFCGKGNNGGDGLAIARLLMEKKYAVEIHSLQSIHSEEDFPPFSPGTIIIDALYGTGLNRKLEGVSAHLVEHINNSGLHVISIDIPSGMFTDLSSKDASVVRADHVLSFQIYKPAFLVPENEEWIGQAHLLDIGLHPGFLENLETRLELTDSFIVKTIHRPRKRFSHKGNFGHALLVAGGPGKMGAAVLSAKACLRSGVGLLSCFVPAKGAEIMQIAVPEAMLAVDMGLSAYKSIGIGPGIGTENDSIRMLGKFFADFQKPMVIDADALNCLGLEKGLLKRIPPGSILTPHPKEFERLFGPSENDFDRIDLAMKKSAEHNCIIILKGHHTLVADSAHHAYINSTGNPGMATAGSGDVLTGILTGMLAQGYSSIEAAILGVYLHGLAGDLAACEKSMEAMIAGDIIDHVGAAYLKFIS